MTITKADFTRLGFLGLQAAHFAAIAAKVPSYADRLASLPAQARAAVVNLENARRSAVEVIDEETLAAMAALREGKPYNLLALIEAKQTLELVTLAQSRPQSNERYMPTPQELNAYQAQLECDKVAREEAATVKRAAMEQKRKEAEQTAV